MPADDDNSLASSFNPDATTMYTPGDNPPGPGWWKASDGEWYPPQSPTDPAGGPSARVGTQSGWAEMSPVSTASTAAVSPAFVPARPEPSASYAMPSLGEPVPATSAPPEVQSRVAALFPLLAIAGFGLCLTGLVLPWAKILFLSVAGYETSDGKIVAGSAFVGLVLAAIAAIRGAKRVLTIPMLVVALVAAIVAGIDLVDIESAAAAEELATAGVGIYLSLFGAVVAAGMSIASIVKGSN